MHLDSRDAFQWEVHRDTSGCTLHSHNTMQKSFPMHVQDSWLDQSAKSTPLPNQRLEFVDLPCWGHTAAAARDVK